MRGACPQDVIRARAECIDTVAFLKQLTDDLPAVFRAATDLQRPARDALLPQKNRADFDPA
jgi:hypothetical protein